MSLEEDVEDFTMSLQELVRSYGHKFDIEDATCGEDGILEFESRSGKTYSCKVRAGEYKERIVLPRRKAKR